MHLLKVGHQVCARGLERVAGGALEERAPALLEMADNMVGEQLGGSKDSLTERAFQDEPALGAKLGVGRLAVHVEALQADECHWTGLALVEGIAMRVHDVACQFVLVKEEGRA